MFVTTAEVEELKEVASESCNDDVLRQPVKGISLPAVIDLCCWAKQRPRSSLPYGLLNSVFAHPALNTPQRWITGFGVLPPNESFRPKAVEFIPIATGAAQSRAFYFFQERFKAAMRQSSFSVPVAFALAGALQEIVENVEQHSGLFGCAPEGLVGYHVQGNRIGFSVGDTGCGVLASLQSNPAWTQLADSAAALAAITHLHASRRIGLGAGEGIRQLFKSLADLNGWLRFRSGDAFLELRGDGRSRRKTVGAAVPDSGLQVAVTCSRSSLQTKMNVEELIIDTLT